MKVFAVSGLHTTGKTTTVVALIGELILRGLRVSTIKDIHYEGFAMDKEGTNTWKHRMAGASTVVARSLDETDFLFKGRMAMDDVLQMIDADVVIIEGGHDEPYPRITCATSPEEADIRFDDHTFAVAGRIADEMISYRGVPSFNPMKDAALLAELALAKACVVEGFGGRCRNEG